MRLFFFGTLMDTDVRDIVLGGPLPPERVEPARIQGFRRVCVDGRSYPMLLPHSSGWVPGMLVHGLDAQAVHRLQMYEGWEYHLVPVRVATSSGTVRAGVFLCDRAVRSTRRGWRLPDWQRRHKRIFLRRAEALMERYEKKLGLVMRRSLPQVMRVEPKRLSGRPPTLRRWA